jgi:Leucine-rich repeat (LRR) protein
VLFSVACGLGLVLLVTLIAGLLGLRRLRSLYLSVRSENVLPRKSFCTLPEAFSRLSALTSLVLERYFLAVETRALLHLPSLQRLALVENPLRDPTKVSWVRHLPSSLRNLEVTGNSWMSAGIDYGKGRRAWPIRTVPWISGLSHITRVSFQLLRGFTPCEWGDNLRFAGLTELRTLELSACGLREVPDAVVSLSRLRCLCLGGNKLEQLPMGQYLQKIEDLILVDNKFSTLPLEAVAAATSLTRLTMGGNPLAWTAAQAGAVSHLKKFTLAHEDFWDTAYC